MKTDNYIDIILANSIEFFTLCNIEFKLPIVWDETRYKTNQIAEWGNYFIEDYGMFHMIKIDFRRIKDDKDLYETFLHELVHAWQYEQKLPVDHGITFLKWVEYFANLGWDIASEDCDMTLLEGIENV